MNNVTEKKWVLVTGGAKRVGAEIVLRLAQDGYNIYLHFRSSQTEAEETKKKAEGYGAQIHLVAGDLSNKNDVRRIFEEISPDAVIHNAADFATSKPKGNSLADILEAEEIAFNRNMAANAMGPLLVTKAAIHRMRQEKKGGTFIFIGDACIHGNGDAYGSDKDAYIMSKSYVPFVSKHRAIELSKEGFFFHAVLNGPIDPPAGAPKETVSKIAEDLNVPPAFRNPWLGGASVAEVISLLLKMPPAATGTIFTVDGARGRVTPPEH
ncbi:MAG: SDR family NAD(P)-dependent oxidoreductase [Patescibacteria group bacterium]